MRGLVVLFLFLLGCGARTALSEGEAVNSPDAGPPGPCEPMAPEVFSEISMTPLAVAGGQLWGTGFDDRGVGYLDLSTGEGRRVPGSYFGVSSMVAGEGGAGFTYSGFGDFSGELLWVDGAGTRALHSGLFHPGAIELDGREIYYAEWTNSGSLRDEMRGRILRLDRPGGAPRELATGLGLPTDTAIDARFVYWVDRRRQHVARVPRDGGPLEIVVEARSLGSDIAIHDGSLYFSTPTSRSGHDLFRVDLGTFERSPFATVDRQVRGLYPTEYGMVVQLFSGSTSLAFVPWDRGDAAVLDPEGAHPVVGQRRLYWSVGSAAAGTDRGLVRVCLEHLATL